MNYNQILSYLSSLTQTVNSFISNSKKIEELPEQITIVPSSEIHVSESGTSKRLKISKIASLALSLFQNNVNDKFTTIGTITRNVNDFTFDGFEAIIGGETITMLTSETITIEEAADGFKRIDIAVLNSLGHVVLIYGQESETIALQPTIPTGTLLITTWSIEGSTIGDNSSVIPDDFIKKSFYNNYAFNGSGENQSIPVNPSGYTDIRLTNNSLISIGGMDLSLITGNSSAEQPFNGKPYLLRNLTANPVVIKHNYSEADIPFFTQETSDLTIPVGGVVFFNFDFGGCEILLKNWNDSSGGLADAPSNGSTYGRKDGAWTTVGGDSKSFFCTWKLGGAMAASTSWYAQGSLSGLNGAFTANASLTPSNAFANLSVQSPAYSIPFNAKIKSITVKGWTNGTTSATIRLCVVRSNISVLAGGTIQNSAIIGDVSFALNDPFINAFHKQFTSTGLTTTTQNAETETRLVLFNNNQSTPLQDTIIIVEFEKVV